MLRDNYVHQKKEKWETKKMPKKLEAGAEIKLINGKNHNEYMRRLITDANIL